MNNDFDYQNRQVIPRWYPYNIACLTSEVYSNKITSAPKIFTRNSYRKKELEWLENRTLPYAIDLVGTALIADDYKNPAACEASEFILKNSNETSRIAVEIAEKMLKPSNYRRGPALREIILNQIYLHISHLKGYVREYPINSIPWADMAFYYSVLGQKQQAKHCMSVALSLGAENRFILRSASRCFLHIGEPDRALYVLRKTRLARQDPWVIASEISIAEVSDLTSKRIREGRDIIKRGIQSPRDLAELLGTMGTLEFNSGSSKKAKRLFKNALIDPNENTTTQAEWIAPKMGTTFERANDKIPALFEANARMSLRHGNYKNATRAAWKWLEYQPYSSRPAVFGSYAASIGMQDEHEAIRIIEAGRIASPNDFLLINNYAFSLASINKVDKAIEIIRSINVKSLSESYKGVYLATCGLLSFRIGNRDEGRTLYKKAVRIFQRIGRKAGLALAYLFWGREEARLNLPESSSLLAQAKNLARESGLNEVLQYVELIEKSRSKRDIRKGGLAGHP